MQPIPALFVKGDTSAEIVTIDEFHLPSGTCLDPYLVHPRRCFYDTDLTLLEIGYLIRGGIENGHQILHHLGEVEIQIVEIHYRIRRELFHPGHELLCYLEAYLFIRACPIVHGEVP